jgi:ORF6N domain
MRNKSPNIRILTIREQKVVLDTDLAAVYGVTTKRLNEQLRRNRKRFPEDFAFQLAADEFESLRAQIATSSKSMAAGELANWSQIATSSRKHRGRAYRPWAFTEHGALQVANILRSERAIAMSVYVIRAFIELREKIAANAAILRRLVEIDKSLLEHDTALRDIYQKLLPLLAPPAEPPRRQIGFHGVS